MIRARDVLAGALAVLVVLAVAAPARAQEEGAGPSEPEAPYDFYCPECRRPIRFDQEECPQCGTRFEPLRARQRLGEGAAAPPEGPPLFEAGGPPEAAPPAEGERLIDSPWPQIQPPTVSRFGFGSYGRVGVIVDDRLHGAESHDLTDFPPRLTKGPYQELHFYYSDTLRELPVLIKTTLAFREELFHENGQFDAEFTVRELYAEVNPAENVAFWLGERMYRGDDVYIFDFWPLDDQNTLGAGGAVRLGEMHRVQAHVGFNRIVDSGFFQFETVELPAVVGIGTREAVFLDRYRVTASATYRFEMGSLLLKAHGEVCYLPPGERRTDPTDPLSEQRIPADHGFLIGAEAAYRFTDQTFARGFIRYARGLSAFDELSIPFGFDADFQVTDAWRLLVAAGGAVDTPYGFLHGGVYWQLFADAENTPDDRDDFEQVAVAVRPVAYLGDYVRVGFEASIQAQRHDGVFAATGSRETALTTSFHLLIGVAAGRGPYAKPDLYVFWGVDWLNQGARLTLEERLFDRPDPTNHSFGLLAEWWF